MGERWREPRILAKLAQWFWCGVLGELYGGAVESRMANDVEDLLNWIEKEGELPRTVAEASFQPDRLDRLASRLSAAYKGLNVLVLREGAQDFFWKANIRDLDAEDVALDIHHIFPQDWCERQKIRRKQYNAVVNKTPISYKANRMIGGVAPSVYLKKLQDHRQVQLDDAAMDKILATHLIPANTLRADDFQAFYDARKQSLIALIERAMGKSVMTAQASNDTGEEEHFEDDDEQDNDEQSEPDDDGETGERANNRDTTRFDLRIDRDTGQELHQNLPKRELVHLVVREALSRNFKPRDLISNTRTWVFVDGKHNKESFLQAAVNSRLEGSSGSHIKRFYTDDDRLFYVDGKTYALTKQWGSRSLPTVKRLISQCGLNNVKYEATASEEEQRTGTDS